jgi:serine-type D-Ala-D-Ala carboxypeptidase/endopeptidase
MANLLRIVPTAFVIFASSLSAQTPQASTDRPTPSKDSLQRVVRQRVDAGKSTGIILGVIQPGGVSYHVAAGNAQAGKPISELTVFEIGSITKAFTGILLADMVARGEVRLDQPVAELLPAGTKVPSRNGRAITLADLSTQTSGLPRLPGNMRPADQTNPYADYTPQMLYDFLASHELRRDPGAQYEYSNLGVGLLGHALALRAAKSYEALLRERVLAPLGLSNTAITLRASMQQNVSEGHDGAGRVVRLWDLPTLAGAGALRSPLQDMMLVARAMIDPPSNALGRAIASSMAPRFTANQALTMGLGWHRVVLGGDTVVFHNGGTAGFRTFMGVNLKSRVGVVLLTNSAQDNEDLARHVLAPSLPLAVTVRRTEIAVPRDVLAQYAGTYRITPQFALTIAVGENGLTLQATGQPQFPLFAESRDKFFLKAVDAQLEFSRDSTGAVSGVVLVQNGARMPGAREKP